MTIKYAATRTVLLRRHGAIYVEPAGAGLPDPYLQLFEVNMADAGYAVSSALRARLQTVQASELGLIQAWAGKALLEKTGGHRKFTPQFRRFPDDVPADTFRLWYQRVLSHFMQAESQPCLHCARLGTTHVIRPCCHVVCDACFDGANYSACPVCGHHSDGSSPFFQASEARPQAQERATFKLLHLGGVLHDDARALFAAMCLRTQAMSPADKDDFLAILREYGGKTLAWLPEQIPVRETVALLFGTLLKTADAALVMQAAARHLATATDVLRLIASYSGADPALQGEVRYRSVPLAAVLNFARFKELLKGRLHAGAHVQQARTIRRFKVAPLARPLRRALLAFMESLDPASLTEDMLRHRSYWVWMGQFLHPGEYAKRYPQTASAFLVIRKKDPAGQPAPAFSGYYARLEAAGRQRDHALLRRLLAQRPGEFARRLDHALRLAGDDAQAVDQLLEAFATLAPRLATPMLLTLRALMPTRVAPLQARIFWPKGGTSQAVFAPDRRAPLAPEVAVRIVQTAEAELLARFARLPRFGQCVLDDALAGVIAPFNERTASRSAIQLPRGSTLAVAPSKKVRLFLHWCEPQSGGQRTDLDLSVAFYNAQWELVGQCTYYELSMSIGGDIVATSSGDLTSAPYPEGASEFIDVDRDLAVKHGIRYAVAVINNYSGSAFGDLEHAFAGLMLRDDLRGQHFDPRTVELKFDLQGGGGIFMPMVFDLAHDCIHWLDVYSRGRLEFNNVATSNRAITAICPAMISYFGAGVRTSMRELGMLHAAARTGSVTMRAGAASRTVTRAAGESHSQFLARLRDPACADSAGAPPHAPVLALLADGDLELPAGSEAYVLKPALSTGNLAAGDLIR